MRRDGRLVFIIFLVSAAGMASVFRGYRLLTWVMIASSDFYLFSVLLLAALLSDDEDFLKRHRWMTAFLPGRRTAGLLVVTLLNVAVISGFAGPYVGTDVFPSKRRWMRFTLAPLHWPSPITPQNLVMVNL